MARIIDHGLGRNFVQLLEFKGNIWMKDLAHLKASRFLLFSSKLLSSVVN